MNLVKAFLTIFVISVLCGCCPNLDKDKIKSEISKDLKIGDSREKVEDVLKNNRIEFTYDEYENLYSSNIRGGNCEFDRTVLVTIYLDSSGRVSKIETSDSYTFL